MKSKKTLMGIVLLLFGVAWLLSDLGYIGPVNIRPYILAITDLWPLLLVIAGTFLVTKKRSSRTLVVIISISIWAIYVLDKVHVLNDIQRMITG